MALSLYNVSTHHRPHHHSHARVSLRKIFSFRVLEKKPPSRSNNTLLSNKKKKCLAAEAAGVADGMTTTMDDPAAESAGVLWRDGLRLTGPVAGVALTDLGGAELADLAGAVGGAVDAEQGLVRPMLERAPHLGPRLPSVRLWPRLLPLDLAL
jgi:hypothetical protein